ncbi:MAG: penicillin-binding transpeptidase domain-containing protein [Fusobacteriaceae bacterium]
MSLILKVILLLLNLILGGFIFYTYSKSLGVYIFLLFFYQIYVYMSMKSLNRMNYFNKRSKIASMIFNFVLIAIIARLADVQIIKGNYYEELLNKQSKMNIKKQGKRGTIFDNTGKQLAFNRVRYNVIVDPSEVSTDEKSILFLEELKKQNILTGDLKKLKEELQILGDRKSKYKVIERRIDEDKKDEILELVKVMKIKRNNIFFEPIVEREYYRKSLYQNLVGNIGFTQNVSGFEKIGNFGVEKFYENYLKAKTLKLEVRGTKSRDIKLPTSGDRIERSLDGNNVYLTINDEINYILNDEMEKQFHHTSAEESYAVIMNPNNGKIIATSYFTRSSRDLRNPIFQDQFEPGSTFKPLIVGAALEDKYIKKDSLFDVGNGTIRKFKHTIKEASRSTRGILTTEDILKKSSNVGMVLIGDKYTDEKFEEVLKRYGLYEKTGIDFPSELRPNATHYEKWDKLKRSTMSFGQGIVVTPIQMITAFSAVINGGILYEPYMVEKIETQDGKVIRRNLPNPIRRVLSEKNSEIIKGMLENTVATGGGKKAIVNGYRLGGKTGTAQVAKPGGGYFKSEYLASFIGFLPVEKPEYVILIMFMKPQAEKIYERFGGSVSAPIFGEVVGRITKNKNMLPTNVRRFPADNDARKEDTVILDRGLVNNPENIEYEIMPDLKDLTTSEILTIFKNSKYELEIKGKGVVKTQFPEAGTDLKIFDKIQLNLESGEL